MRETENRNKQAVRQTGNQKHRHDTHTDTDKHIDKQKQKQKKKKEKERIKDDYSNGQIAFDAFETTWMILVIVHHSPLVTHRKINRKETQKGRM